jgi:EAL domain-containing protein (putative c-di-GMP-specific phosphodiesterase class I)
MQLESFPSPETLHRGVARTPGEDRRQRQELRHAAQTGGFQLAFQPRRNLAHDVTVGAALQLRWPRRGGGTTPANGFMPLLESLGLAGDVAAWALDGACVAAAAWPRGQICVAADAGALRQGKLLLQVAHALAVSGLAPERLELDIAEPALAEESSETLFTLAALRDLGVGVALDRFGSESASLLPLKRLPLTAVKLDRSLVRDLPDDAEAAAIVAAVIQFAHALEVTVVACGVETAAQGEFLRRNGCDEAQGSLCGRVMQAGEICSALA